MYKGGEDWSEEVHLCRYCDSGFNSAATLLEHQCKVKKLLLEQTDPKYNIDCNQCLRRFTSRGGLDYHRKSVHEGHVVYCPNCGKEFKQKGNLDRHIATVHFQVKAFPCTHCDKRFRRRDYLTTHIASVHEGFKRFKCPTCGKGFSQRPNLNRHIKTVHMNEKGFPCLHCGKRFGQKRNLEAHVAGVHEGVRYSCDLCDHSTTCKSDLSRHVKVFHDKNCPFPCSICNSGYVKRKALDTHMMKSHPVEYQQREEEFKVQHPEQCNKCAKRFKNKAELKRHKDHIHTQELRL